ncbi:MAG: FHA domain-containing protein [Planctomycetota bacterium]
MLTLIQLKPDELGKPQTYRLAADQPHVLGRRDVAISLHDTRVSRRHAEVSVQNGTWVIRDLGSSNGTWVNGSRIQGLCELEEGDRLAIGRVTLIVGHVAVESENETIDIGDATAVIAEEALAESPDESAGLSSIDLDAELDLDSDLEPIDAELLSDIQASENTHEPVADHSGGDESSDEQADPIDTDHPASSRTETEPPSPTPPTDFLQNTAEEEVDEYSASVDFVTPTSRPDSPLSPTDIAADVEDSSAADVELDAPPPVVGLSLDMPGPEAAPAEAAADSGPPEEVTVASTAEDPQSPVDSSTLEEPKQTGPSLTASESTQPVSADVETAEPDWVDSEEQQEIDEGHSSSRPNPRKLLAALVVIAIAAGGGFWYVNQNKNDTKPDTGTDAFAFDEGQDVDANVPSPLPPATSPPTPPTRQPSELPPGPASTTTSTTSPERLEIAEQPLSPTPSITSTQPAEPVDPLPEQPKSDPFGQGPTLAAITPSAPPTAAPPTTEVTPPSQEPLLEVQPTAPARADSPPSVPETTATPPTLQATEPLPGPLATPADLPALLDVPEFVEETESSPASPTASPTGREIVYVVDASGSMVDSMNQGALTWLESQLAGLTNQDRFTVLFFRSGEVIETPPNGLKPSIPSAREETLQWVDPAAGNFQLRGQSEPMAALQRAISYTPTDIYILSDDKFGQRRAMADFDIGDLEPLLDESPPLVHTVQFFYKNEEDNRLQAIAQRFGGEYEFVAEPPFEIDPGDDLGLDFLGISR